MTDQELQEIEEMIAVKLCPEIDWMFAKKGINAKRKGASTDHYFLHIELLVDMGNDPRIALVEINLQKSYLCSRGACSEVDKSGGWDKNKFSLPDLVKIRVLRVIFDICKDVYTGKIKDKFEHRNNIKASFANASGNIFYYN